MEGVLSSLGLGFENVILMGFGVFNVGGVIFMIVGIGFFKRLVDKYGKWDVFGIVLLIFIFFILIFYLFLL